MFTVLKTTTIHRKARDVLLALLLIMMLTTGLASAAGEEASVFVTRLTGTYIGVKIIFPEPISGNFAGVINGNHFDCETIPPDTLYCVGPLAALIDAATLHVYENPSGNIILSTVISAPPRNGDIGVLPSPEPKNEQCPPGECETSPQ